MDRKEDRQKGLVKEIKLGDGVSASYHNGILSVNGKKGEAKKGLLSKNLRIEVKENKIILECKRYTKREKKMIASFESHIKNLLNGVSEGYKYVLKVCSGHFPMNVSVSNNEFTIKNFLGEKVPRKLKIKENATVKVEGDQIIVESLNKETCGQVSADIENLTRRPGYDSRIFQDGIFIVAKDNRR